MPEEIHGFTDGQRVFHAGWGTYGRVHFINLSNAEVRWEGLSVADELTEQLARSLTPA